MFWRGSEKKAIGIGSELDQNWIRTGNHWDALENKTMEIKIKNIVEFKDSDLVDQTIREYLGYAQEDDYIIKLN